MYLLDYVEGIPDLPLRAHDVSISIGVFHQCVRNCQYFILRQLLKYGYPFEEGLVLRPSGCSGCLKDNLRRCPEGGAVAVILAALGVEAQLSPGPSSTMLTLNEIRSNAHKRALVAALHVAVRGVLYIRASSPNDSPGPIDFICDESGQKTHRVACHRVVSDIGA